MLWLPTLGACGLLLAKLLNQILQTVLFLLLIQRLVPGIGWRRISGSVGKIGISSVAMFAALHWIVALGVHPEATLVSRAWSLFGQIAIGGLVFLAVARMLNIEELALAWNTILTRFERNVMSPPENRDAPTA